jgi:hypothetical protein
MRERLLSADVVFRVVKSAAVFYRCSDCIKRTRCRYRSPFWPCFPPDCYSLAGNGNDVLVSLDGRCSDFIGLGIVFISILTVSIRSLIRRTWRLASIGTVSIRYLIMPTMLSTALRVVSIRYLRMQHRGLHQYHIMISIRILVQNWSISYVYNSSF